MPTLTSTRNNSEELEMNIKPTWVTIWKKQHKTRGTTEFVELFISYKTGRDSYSKYNNVAAVAYGDVARQFTNINIKQSIQVLEGQMRFPTWEGKDGQKKSKGELTIFKFQKEEDDKKGILHASTSTR